MSAKPDFQDIMTFEEVSAMIRVAAQSYYLPDQSDPINGRFVWAYRIRVTNERDHPVQLLSRHWVITDGRGKIQHVRGPGVVGEQPVIAPKSHFTYTSGTPLSTPSGFMRGSYEMQVIGGENFTVLIPAFSLDSPHAVLPLH